MKRAVGRLALASVVLAVAVAAIGAGAARAEALFAPAKSYPVSGYPNYLAAGDFNGDGSLDFAVTAYATESVGVLLNNSMGGFGSETSHSGGSDPEAMAVGDFNGDGRPDLAVSNFNKGTVSVLLNNGLGGFEPPTTYELGAGAFARAVVVGDFNGDGKLDIATADTGENHGVSVLLNNGKGGFAPVTNYRFGEQMAGITVGDFNGDGKPDIAVTDNILNKVYVLLNDGAGGFGAPTGYSVPSRPFGVAAADFNGDGKLDIATADNPSGTASVLLNNGSGGFEPAVNYPAGGGGAIAVGDFNGDGKPDLVTTDIGAKALSVLLNNGGGIFGAPTAYAVGEQPEDVKVGDFNGDGKPDIADADHNSKTVSVLMNTNGSLLRTTSTSATCSPSSVAVGTSTSCTATVTDTSASGQTTPTGTVSFASSGGGNFSSNPCKLAGNGASASCSVSYVPSAVGSGTHTITASYGGDGAHEGSSGSTALTVSASSAEATVTKVEPNHGPLAGGTTVTITGTRFTGATAVRFGSTNAKSFQVKSASAITAVSPAGSGNVDVTVTTPEGTSASSPSDVFSYTPTVTRVEPGSGPAVGGTSVSISGTGFLGATSVKFGGAKASSFSVSSTGSITAVSPPGKGVVDVTVTTPAGTSATGSADRFNYGPSVSGVQPSAGPATGGTAVTVTGANFSGAKEVKFGGAKATSFSVTSAESITAVSPAGKGVVDVTVTTPGGTSATSTADRFNYGPSVTGVEPSAGPLAGGTSVTITGSNFNGAKEVKFGGSKATSFKANSEGSITAVSPAGKGTVDVTVTTLGGTSPTSSADRFSYVTASAPTVTRIEPSSGPEAGSTSVTLTGSGFTGATAVKFGSTNAASFSVNSATSITAVSPAGTGTVDVTVTTPAGTSATSTADRFSYVVAPIVERVVPRRGSNGGGTTVEVIGRNFNEVQAVAFGPSFASFTRTSETSITAISPPFTSGSASVPVTVRTPGGISSTQSHSTILPEFYFRYGPIVTNVSPGSGPTAGGTSVTILGKAFESVRGPDEFPPFVHAVRFGSTNATSFEVHQPGFFGGEPYVTAVAPAGTGTVDVTVETGGGVSPITPADRYSYGPPTVTKVEPTGGPALGGTSVSVTGTAFQGARVVRFGSKEASFTVNSETAITAFSPPGTGTVDVTVETSGGTSGTSAADQFTYGPAEASSGRLYVTRGNLISLFTLGAEGTLLENGTLAFSKEIQSPERLVVSPDHNSLYVGTEENNFNGTVHQFTIASDGTLTLKQPPWVSNDAPARPDGLVMSPDGTSLYAAGGEETFGAPGQVAQYNVEPGGLLSFKEPPTVAAGAGPAGGEAIAPNGSSVYVSNFGGNTISQYSVGAGGRLIPMTPATVPSGAEPRGVAISPDGSSLYVADYAQNAISQYSIGAGGALSPKNPATVSAGQEPAEVATTPDGKSVYVSDKVEEGKISQYAVGPGGALSANKPASVSAERQPLGLMVSPDGKNLYVAESVSNTVSQYRIEADGSLTLVATAHTRGSGPTYIAFSP